VVVGHHLRRHARGADPALHVLGDHVPAQLAQRGRIGVERRARLAGDGDDAQLTGIHQAAHLLRRGDAAIHRAGDDGLQRGPAAGEGHMQQLRAGRTAQQQEDGVAERADSGRGVAQRLRPCAGGGHQLLRGGEAPAAALHDDELPVPREADDGREAALGVVGHLAVRRHGGGFRAAGEQQRMPIGRHPRHLLGRQRPARARPVHHDERHGIERRHGLGDGARDHVAAAAGRKAGDELDRARGHPARLGAGGPDEGGRGEQCKGGAA
jgi:hypothetical protein